MNDYKELIAKLRFYADTADDPIYGICINSPKVMFQAADAIEQLVKERDAAIKDMNTLCSTFADICSFCKNDSRNDGDVCVKCKGTDWLKFWEWRGVKEDNDEID